MSATRQTILNEFTQTILPHLSTTDAINAATTFLGRTKRPEEVGQLVTALETYEAALAVPSDDLTMALVGFKTEYELSRLESNRNTQVASSANVATWIANAHALIAQMPASRAKATYLAKLITHIDT